MVLGPSRNVYTSQNNITFPEIFSLHDRLFSLVYTFMYLIYTSIEP